MITKWRIDIEGLEEFFFGEDGEVYKKPYENMGRNYEWRKISMQYPNRWKMNGRWWSKRQIKPYLVIDENPKTITRTDNLPY